MDLLWMMLPVFVVCAEALNMTEVQVQLGLSITLTCSENLPDLYWYAQIHGQLIGFIGRTFSGNYAPSICSPNNTSKYLLQGNTLEIKNITADDCRLYFCGKKKNSNIIYLDTFLLVSDRKQEQYTWTMMQSNPVMFGSLTLNALLLLVTIGLGSTSLCFKKKTRDVQVNGPSPVTYDNTETLETPQYEEIQFTTSTVRPAAPPLECIYYKAQLPRSPLPQH
ncbi:uncharacterized protein LOC111235573 [Seriola dumerili]|uniref:uncharacterized protein LOC111235573 n=1 Tax=Seriola dumerili TaxID=41447 RepID=UPI000BBEE8DD|nr:uncharacterized protein LOC111235573 [Seriola dumerili]XP_022619778.1 uncharacterized protein LOC111235573 [Seriola dumerili]